MYKITFTKQAVKDYQNVLRSEYKSKVLKLLAVLKEDPFQPPLEKLVDQKAAYSRRINIQHRLVYEIVDETTVKIIRMWTHYGDN